MVVGGHRRIQLGRRQLAWFVYERIRSIGMTFSLIHLPNKILILINPSSFGVTLFCSALHKRHPPKIDFDFERIRFSCWNIYYAINEINSVFSNVVYCGTTDTLHLSPGICIENSYVLLCFIILLLLYVCLRMIDILTCCILWLSLICIFFIRLYIFRHSFAFERVYNLSQCVAMQIYSRSYVCTMAQIQWNSRRVSKRYQTSIWRWEIIKIFRIWLRIGLNSEFRTAHSACTRTTCRHSRSCILKTIQTRGFWLEFQLWLNRSL